MNSIDTIKETYEERPALMLEEAVRAWAESGYRNGGGDDLISTDRYVKCEIDGERMAGVVWASIEIDQDGDACLMLFRDTTLAAHVASGTGLPLPLAVAVRPRHEL